MAQNSIVLDLLHLELERPPYQRPKKISAKARNDLEWDSHKEEICQIYVEQDKTLKQTMNLIEEKHGFQASARKWKMKLKEWQLEKYLHATEMNILVSKREKRLRDEGKETEFFHNGIEITDEKFRNFKKRSTSKALVNMTSPSADTPMNIAYNTLAPQTLTPEASLEEFPLDPSKALEWDSRIHDKHGLAVTRRIDGHDIQNHHSFANETQKDAAFPTSTHPCEISDHDASPQTGQIVIVDLDSDSD